MGTLNEAVVDSSVIIARYLPEKHSIWAKQKMSEFSYFHVLDLNYYEVANALKHTIPERLTSKEAGMVFSKAEKMMNLFNLHSFSNVIDGAYALAVDLDITVYDAAFVSLAESLGIHLLTLDEKLAKKLENTKYCKLLEFPSK